MQISNIDFSHELILQSSFGSVHMMLVASKVEGFGAPVMVPDMGARGTCMKAVSEQEFMFRMRSDPRDGTGLPHSSVAKFSLLDLEESRLLRETATGLRTCKSRVVVMRSVRAIRV